MIRKILIALDGSELAEQAIPLASTIASRADAEIVLMTAIVPGDGWAQVSGEQAREEEEREAAGSYLESVRARMPRPEAEVRMRVVSGRAAAAISAAADDEGADLIAMTTHGRSGLARWVMGSVADKVLHTSRKPLLLVHAREAAVAPEPQLDRILVPLDGSPLAESVLPFVEQLARSLQASLLIEKVILPAVALYGDEIIPSAAPALEKIEASASEYLRGVAKAIERAGVPVETGVETGYPAETILEAAERQQADLIALCSHGRSGPDRWIMGSVADAVVRHSTRPCLVMPARAIHAGEEPPAAGAAAGIVPGTVVVPPPTWLEPLARPRRRPSRAPEVRPHRPERSPGR